MNWATYLIQVNVYVSIFYLFYLLLLRKETFFNLNRAYLIATSIISLGIPAYQFPWVNDFFVTERIEQIAAVIVYEHRLYISPNRPPEYSFSDYCYFAYCLVAGLLLIRFIFRLFMAISKAYQHVPAFSFLGRVYVADYLEERETIIRHEKVHVHQLHSADVI